MLRRTTVALYVLLCAVLPASAQTPPPGFTVTDLTELIPGATDAAAFDVSPSGLIAGTVRVGFGASQVGLWTASSGTALDSIFGSEWARGVSDDGILVGSFTGTANGWYYRNGVFDCIPLPDPCGSFNNIWRISEGSAINGSNVFTGSISPSASDPPNDPVQAYLGRFEDDGEVLIQRLGTYLGQSTRGTDLNNLNEAVGISGTSLQYTALLFRNGTVEALPDLGGEYNWAEGINDRGFAVGIASVPGAAIWPYPADGLLWDTNADPITFEVLGRLPGARQTRPLDLNETNQVVGTSIDPDFNDQRAVLWQSGTLHDLNELIPADSGWTLLVANAINDAGWIVGYGRKAGVPGRRAFLLKPAVLFTEDFEDGHLGEWTLIEP